MDATYSAGSSEACLTAYVEEQKLTRELTMSDDDPDYYSNGPSGSYQSHFQDGLNNVPGSEYVTRSSSELSLYNYGKAERERMEQLFSLDNSLNAPSTSNTSQSMPHHVNKMSDGESKSFPGEAIWALIICLFLLIAAVDWISR